MGRGKVLELLTPSQMAQADAAAAASGISPLTLMENAGQAVVYEIVRHYPIQPVLVLCGPGNNGGDGFVVARLLAERGWPVRVMFFGERARMKREAALVARLWTGPLDPAEPHLGPVAGIIVDALFGAGLSRDIEGDAAKLIAAINASGAQVVSVDIPSGVDGDTGAVRGIAVAAELTVTFFRCKPGHLLYPGRGLCGTVELADIGIPESALAELDVTTFENDPRLWTLPQRRPDGHKYDGGHCVVVSADRFHTGAARLAALGAARIGAGLVTLAGNAEALAVHAAHVTAIMLAQAPDAAALAGLLDDPRRNAVVVGPGLPPDANTRALVLAALVSGAGVVLDAGALTAFAGRADEVFEAIARRSNPNVVLTPHHGEFVRLFGEGEASKLDRALEAAQRSGATLVYKGADSVVAGTHGRAVINHTGTPHLATAGTGDVLAGMIAGLIGQGMGGFEAACAAVHIHGLAGEAFGGPGLVADDLPGLIPGVLGQITPPPLVP